VRLIDIGPEINLNLQLSVDLKARGNAREPDFSSANGVPQAQFSLGAYFATRALVNIPAIFTKLIK
jgi:hypothetical protein